jgi:N-acyl-D-amino-acid deacylase
MRSGSGVEFDMHKALLLAVAVVLGGAVGPHRAQQPEFDVVIRNGRVMDGSGNPWRRVDIGIREDRIAAVGRLGEAAARRAIDAGGRLVTPGFIDVHSHAGEGLTRADLRQGRPLLAQGLTTIVANPDGGGPVDLARQREEFERGGLGPNVALLVGHGSVRGAVIGREDRAPTTEELARMRALVRAGMEQGAFGLSSGLFYTPGSYAETEEVIALAREAAAFGGVYTSHIRDEGDYTIGVVAAVQEVIRIADEGGLPGIVSHMKALGPDNWGLSAAMTHRIEQARARGVEVFADQYPYEASSTSLGAALLPGGLRAPSAEELARPVTSLEPAAREARAALDAALAENLRRRGGPDAIQIAFHRADPSIEGRTLAQIAAARGVAPERAALEILAAGGASIVSYNMAEDDIRHIMRQPYTMTSSDGGLVPMTSGRPHPRNYGAFSRKLALYVRERRVVDLEFAIRSMTSLPASVFGMRDRGVIREGAMADVVIFDPAAVQDRATYVDPHQLSEGMEYVLVNGVAVIDRGQFTDALPGRVLRR